jgi:hypothetical protein
MIMFAPCTTGTLSIKGINWCYMKCHGRVAFAYRHHSILFEPRSGYYQLREKNETVFAARSVTECLENAAEYVWDFYAAKLIPSWEN